MGSLRAARRKQLRHDTLQVKLLSGQRCVTVRAIAGEHHWEPGCETHRLLSTMAEKWRAHTTTESKYCNMMKWRGLPVRRCHQASRWFSPLEDKTEEVAWLMCARVPNVPASLLCLSCPGMLQFSLEGNKKSFLLKMLLLEAAVFF